MPVLYYIHDGGYFFSSAEADKSPEFFMDYNLVVVMPNYRVGVLGFLSTEDEVMPGNMGLKDQNLAMIWVQNNIANFGGDPNQVTLTGDSAGGASVHYHMFSPLSRGLFHRAISQTVSALANWVNVPPGVARSRAIKMAQLFNCSTESSQTIFDCLRTKNSYELTESSKQFMVFQVDPIAVFVPIFDKNAKKPFLPFNPHEVESAPVPWIIGVCSLEGLGRTGVFVRNPADLIEFGQKFNQVAPISLFYDTTASNPEEVTRKIREFYFGDQPIDMSVFRNFTNMYTDGLFIWPAVEALQKHKGPHYLYYFNYLGESSFQEVFAGKRVLTGSAHKDDSLYVWRNRNPVDIPPPTTRVPTPEGFDFDWPLWDNQQQNFITFENSGITLNSSLLPDRMQFWSTLNFRDKVDQN
uniref:Carboxylic ester hydrolase n=1 Tax=Rhodnius prolixus TaxID=13249 RepID=T1HB33_RHOPR